VDASAFRFRNFDESENPEDYQEHGEDDERVTTNYPIQWWISAIAKDCTSREMSQRFKKNTCQLSCSANGLKQKKHGLLIVTTRQFFNFRAVEIKESHPCRFSQGTNDINCNA